MLPQKKPLSKVYELLVHFNVCVLLKKGSYFPYWSWAYWTSALVLPSRFAIAVIRKHYIKVKPKRFKTCSNVFQSERVFIDSFVALQRLLRYIWAIGIIDCCGYDEFIKWVELITCNRLPSGLILGILLKILRIRSLFPCESKPSWKKNADPRLTLNNQLKFVKRRVRSFLRKRSLAWFLRGRNACEAQEGLSTRLALACSWPEGLMAFLNHSRRELLESWSFTYTANGKRQIQADNFSKQKMSR